MRFFRMDSNFFEDDKVEYLYHKYGAKGCWHWMVVVGLISEKFDPSKPNLPITYRLQRVLRVLRCNLKSISRVREELLLMNCSVTLDDELTPSTVTFTYPNFLKKQIRVQRDGGGKYISRAREEKREEKKRKEPLPLSPPPEFSTPKPPSSLLASEQAKNTDSIPASPPIKKYDAVKLAESAKMSADQLWKIWVETLRANNVAAPNFANAKEQERLFEILGRYPDLDHGQLIDRFIKAPIRARKLGLNLGGYATLIPELNAQDFDSSPLKCEEEEDWTLKWRKLEEEEKERNAKLATLPDRNQEVMENFQPEHKPAKTQRRSALLQIEKFKPEHFWKSDRITPGN